VADGLDVRALAAVPSHGVCDEPRSWMVLQADDLQAYPTWSRRNTHALVLFRCDRRAWVKLPTKSDGSPDHEAPPALWCPVCCPDVAQPAGIEILAVEGPGGWGSGSQLNAPRWPAPTSHADNSGSEVTGG
jgi:hypothetical protein